MGSICSTSRYSQFEEFAPSTSASGRSYDVFINHRGPDVKDTLATALYKMLTYGMGLRVFLDSQELQSGDSLPTELQEAMKSASLHIAIFSKNYAQSRWCLDELSFMFGTGTRIVPIFYYIDVGDVRYAKGVYAAAFKQHNKKGRYSSKKLKEWKKTLFNVSHNKGYIVNSKEEEDMLLKSVTDYVVKEIRKLPFVVAEHPMGLDEIVKDFESTTLKSDKSHENVQIVGIWGMGGSGKTTLAKKLYNNIYPSMDKASLILNVRDAANKNLLHEMQKKLLQDLGLKNISVDNIEDGKAILINHLTSIRAVIVLDDVDHVDQLNALLPRQGSKNLIGSGTLVIVTTRELEVLSCWNISSLYKMKPLSEVHAKKLFCWHAFLQPFPGSGFEELVQKFLEVCSGLPLSLKVLGGQLYGKSRKDYWESQLERISKIVDKDIKDKLKISYDALDDEDQEVFLDIACFFIGSNSDLVIELWNRSQHSGLYSLEKLRNKCLIEIDEENSIRMHDHLRDMGREIANTQSPYRIWYPQQSIKVGNEQDGIGIRGVQVYDREVIAGCSSSGELMVNTNRGIMSLAPSRLGLKFIDAQACNLNHVISEASEGLVWLRWRNTGETNLQSLFPLKNLRILEVSDLDDLGLRELWVAECDAPLHLRVLDMFGCEKLQGFPKSIGLLKKLKKIVLTYPKSLESLPEEFCLLQSLEHLELDGCEGLSSLPYSMGSLRNLRHLSLRRSEKLGRLPESFKELTLLQHLSINFCTIVTFNSDIMENMSKLEYLDFSGCYQLKELPRHITNQGTLRELDLSYTFGLRELPVNIGQLRKLRKLLVGFSSLTSLPASLGDLSSLTTLHISDISGLECLPDSLGRLSLLEELCIKKSGVKSLPESISQLINLERLRIFSCPVSELNLGAGSFSSSLAKLKKLDISWNDRLSKISISKDCCAGLETFELHYNRDLREIESLPSSVRKLVIARCPKLPALPSFAQLTSLRECELKDCFQVKNIEGLDHCRELEVLKAYTWWEVPGIESLEYMERLRTVHLTGMRKSVVEGCIQSLQKLPGEIIVCTRAVQNAATLVNSLAFPALSVIDTCSNVQTDRNHDGAKLEVKQPTNGNSIIVCFVMRALRKGQVFGIRDMGTSYFESLVEVGEEAGEWVWIGVFTQRSRWYGDNGMEAYFVGDSFLAFGSEYGLDAGFSSVNGILVEKGFLAMVEENRVMEVLCGLMGVMEI